MLSLKNRRSNALAGASVVALFTAVGPMAHQAYGQNASLRQSKNGSSAAPNVPIEWVNGSLNQSGAHYLEGYSVAYRAVLTNLTPGTEYGLRIDWDIRDHGRHAQDFITHYNRLEPHAVVFGHPAETIDPLTAPLPAPAATFTLGNEFAIPAPASVPNPPPCAGLPVGQPGTTFNLLPPGERKVTAYNGTITNVLYVSQGDLCAASSTTVAQINFIASNANAIILWGGHIASGNTWGSGNAAAGINGSSYHMRLNSLLVNPNSPNPTIISLGSESCPLAATAVVVPPDCTVSGTAAICPSSTNNSYTAPDAPAGQTATYAWTIINDTSGGATFCDGTTSATGQTVCVNAGPACGGFTLSIDVTSAGLIRNCAFPVLTQDAVGPVISGSITGVSQQCGSISAAATTIGEFLTLPGITNVTDNCTAQSALTVSSSDGPLSGACPATLTRTYTIRDACQNATTATQTFTLDDTTAPVITGTISGASIQCGALPAAVTTIADFLLLPGITNVTDNCTLTSALTVSHLDSPVAGSCPGTVIRTYFVTDACNNSSPKTQTITIDDTIAPVISGTISGASIQCGALPAAVTTIADFLLLSGITNVTDNCTPQANLTVTHLDSPVTGSCPGTVIRTYFVTDACNNSSPKTQTITIDDTIAPVITGTISPASIQCGALPAAATTIAGFLSLPGITNVTDNCTPQANLTVSHLDSPPSGACPTTIIRTYFVADACNNLSLPKTQTITINDTIAPVISGSICPLVLQCGSAPSAAGTIAEFLSLCGITNVTDNCTPQANLVVSHLDSPISGSCPATIVRTYFIADACNNLTPKTQAITFNDTTPPVISGLLPNPSFECDVEVPPPATTIPELIALLGSGGNVSDNCTPQEALVLTHNDVTEGTPCNHATVRTYTVRDTCNNPASISQTFTAADVIPPTLTSPGNIDMECGVAPVPPVATTITELLNQGGTASDNCTATEDLVLELVQQTHTPDGECPIVITRTYRVTDACENQSEESTQVIRITDITPPHICCVTEITGCAGYPVEIRVPTVTDECGMTIVPVCSREDGKGCTEPFPVGITTIIWSATDGCGNQSEPFVMRVTINPCPQACTKTQSAWAEVESGNVALIQSLLSTANGGNLVVGKSTIANPRSVIIKSAAAQCVVNRLPASGTPRALPVGLGNKTLLSTTCNTSPPQPVNAAGKFTNSLLGHTIALGLNLRYDVVDGEGGLGAIQLCPVMTIVSQSGQNRTYVIPSSVLSALGADPSVGNLFRWANRALAGQSVAPTTISALNSAVGKVNAMFNGCSAVLSTSCGDSLPQSAPALAGQTLPGARGVNLGTSGGSTAGSGAADGTNGGSNAAGGTTNDGLIVPAEYQGILRLDGSFLQTANGALLIQLRGTEPVTGYDILSIDGKASLGGMLKVTVADGFQPQVGDSFDVLQAQSITGEFQELDLAALPEPSYLDVTYGPQAVTVRVKTTPQVAGDLDRSGSVDTEDLVILLQAWGRSTGRADLNHDGTVDASDLSLLLANWGAHPAP